MDIPKPLNVSEVTPRHDVTTEDMYNTVPEMSDTVAEIVTALVSAKLCVPKLVFDKSVKGSFSYKYASLPAVIEAIEKPLLDNGIVLMQSLDGAHLITTLFHKSGEWISSVVGLKAFSSKAGAQGMGGAITYARRYAITAIMGLAADEDTDANEAGQSISDIKKK